MDKLIVTIDDSMVIKAGFENFFSSRNFIHHHVMNGEEAASLLQKLHETGQRIHLIFCDINMPKMDGYQFVAWIKQQPQLSLIPVIMITTETEVSAIQKAKKLGAAGWIIKPVEDDVLQDIINKFAK